MALEDIKSKHQYEPIVYYCGIDGTRCGPMKRDIFLIEACIKGYGTIIINEKAFPITPRSCYFLFPGDVVTHITDDKEPREGYYCALDGAQVESVIQRLGITSESPFAPREVFDEIFDKLRTLYLMRGETDPGAEMRRISHIYGILGALLRTCSATDKNYWVQKAIGYMETNYSNDISVATLASEVGLERTYFSTLFKAQTGVSPYAYLTHLRIKKAAALIEKGGFMMNEIADAVGIDPQNFARIFQREMGKNPRDYKTNTLKLKQYMTDEDPCG